MEELKLWRGGGGFNFEVVLEREGGCLDGERLGLGVYLRDAARGGKAPAGCFQELRVFGGWVEVVVVVSEVGSSWILLTRVDLLVFDDDISRKGGALRVVVGTGEVDFDCGGLIISQSGSFSDNCGGRAVSLTASRPLSDSSSEVSERKELSLAHREWPAGRPLGCSSILIVVFGARGICVFGRGEAGDGAFGVLVAEVGGKSVKFGDLIV